MPPEIRQKIKKLREYWFDDDYSLKWVDSVEKALRKVMVREKLSQNKAVLAILADVKDRLRVIDLMLVNDEEMTEDERRLLLREKKVHNFYLNRFDGSKVEEQFEKVGNILDEELKELGIEQ